MTKTLVSRVEFFTNPTELQSSHASRYFCWAEEGPYHHS